MSKPDGGHAFSMASSKYDIPQHGMTLRQWYAGQALVGIGGALVLRENATPLDVADQCFDYADAMLAEEAKE